MSVSEAKNVLKAAPLQFIVHNAKGLVDTKQGWALPPVCLPSVYQMLVAYDQISQALHLHICILQVIKEWRWEWPGNSQGTAREQG